MIIQVLGSGCPTCKKLFETVKKIKSELKIDAELDYITDIAKMIEMGVMSSPVLAIDGKPVLTGGGHSEEEIKKALTNNLSNQSKSLGGCSCGGKC